MSQTSVDWASLSDFTFSQVTDTVEPVLNINFATSYLTALSPGVVEIKAVHKVTGITRYFDVCIDRYTYELMETFGFSKNDALLIRGLYDKIDDLFPSETKIQRAWKSSRLLGGLVYNNDDWWNNFKWSNVAGKVYDSDEKGYFVDTLNYTETEYNQLKNVVKTQHNSEHPDFAHMQIYLSARLAYQLDKDGFLSNLGTFCSDEEVSYRAGWLGDAITVVDSGTTSMGNDDYCADLDAENIFRIIIQGKTTIEAIEEYYSSFSSTVNRATTFLGHISYETVRDKVFNHLYLTGYNENNLANMKEEYPDTYNFLKSLEDQLAEMGSY